MKRCTTLCLGVALLLPAGCAGERSQLQVRPSAAAISASHKAVPLRLLEAESQLTMGNVALALEAFRRALREDPESVRAFQGIATCYERMGRYDLARRNLELALAVQPYNTTVLNALASSLDRSGKSQEAAQVREEILRPQASASGEDAAQDLILDNQKLALANLDSADKSGEAAPTGSVPVAEAGLPTKALGDSVTIALPPVIKTEPAPSRVSHSREPSPVHERSASHRLERLSLGEVALVTTGRTQFASQVVSLTASKTTVRFAPLGSLRTRHAPRVRLLNAARHQGLAARTRTMLAHHGWRGMAIGDAPRVRLKSVIISPRSARSTAQRLAAQFGIPMSRQAGGTDIVVLLGRDAVAMRPKDKRT